MVITKIVLGASRRELSWEKNAEKEEKKSFFLPDIYKEEVVYSVNGGVGENQKTLHLIKVASNLRKLGISELFAVFEIYPNI